MARPPKTQTEDEQEVKIVLSKGDLEKVFNALMREYAPGHIEHKYLPRHYYDTPNLDLDQNGLSVRMQYKQGKGAAVGGYEQTVKVDISEGATLAAGALFRREIKNPMPDHAPDLSVVTDKQAKQALAPFLKQPLKHIFTAAIERRYYEIELGHGRKKSSAEIAFDVGEIILPHNDSHTPFYEIEIERKSGSSHAIDKLRDKILELAPSARVQPQPKSKQGTELYRRAKLTL
ncbi:MAG TPA: CYTH domain-containing protein [Patescibacteria group bacterium]|nr:CYTH domain-containing protein [Patescibacteria group bacterium]